MHSSHNNKSCDRRNSRPLQTPSKPPQSIRNPLPKAYSRLLRTQQTEEIPYQISLCLRRVAARGPKSLSKVVLRRQVVAVARELLLNELEVVVWSLYLDRFVWNMGEEVEKGMYLAGMATKAYFEEDLDTFEEYLETVCPGIGQKYQQFSQSYNEKLDISPKDLLSCYSTLSMCSVEHLRVAAVDYNDLTDALLALAPPLSQAKPMLWGLDDKGSGGTAPSCSESEQALEWELPLDCWDSPKLTSLAEIWPELT